MLNHTCATECEFDPNTEHTMKRDCCLIRFRDYFDNKTFYYIVSVLRMHYV